MLRFYVIGKVMISFVSQAISISWIDASGFFVQISWTVFICTLTDLADRKCHKCCLSEAAESMHY